MKKENNWVFSIKPSEIFELPSEISFSHRGCNIGVLKIDFLKDSSEVESTKKERDYFILSDLIWIEANYFAKSLESSLNLIQKFQPKLAHNSDLNNSIRIYIDGDSAREFWGVFKDEDIYEFVKEAGPISLSFPMVRIQIEQWLSEDESNLKLEKLIDSLMKYKTSRSKKEIRFKDGPPGIEIFKKAGRSFIKNMYKDMLGFFQYVKKNRVRFLHNDADNLITELFNMYFLSLNENLDNKELSKDEQRKSNKIGCFIGSCTYENTRNPISSCLSYYPEIKKEFFEFKWAPNKMALMIIGKIIGITGDSYQTLKDIIYRS